MEVSPRGAYGVGLIAAAREIAIAGAAAIGRMRGVVLDRLVPAAEGEKAAEGEDAEADDPGRGVTEAGEIVPSHSRQGILEMNLMSLAEGNERNIEPIIEKHGPFMRKIRKTDAAVTLEEGRDPAGGGLRVPGADMRWARSAPQDVFPGRPSDGFRTPHTALPSGRRRHDDEAAAGEAKGLVGSDPASPATAQRIPAAGANPSALTPLFGLRVLVVDDLPDVRRLLSLLLGRLGAIVTTAPGAAEALAMLPGLKLDVLISDIGMPVMNGIDLIRELRKGDLRGLPGIALTAYAHPDDVTRILAAGYDVHVAKPVDTAHLVTTITRLAEEKRRR